MSKRGHIDRRDHGWIPFHVDKTSIVTMEDLAAKVFAAIEKEDFKNTFAFVLEDTSVLHETNAQGQTPLQVAAEKNPYLAAEILRRFRYSHSPEAVDLLGTVEVIRRLDLTCPPALLANQSPLCLGIEILKQLPYELVFHVVDTSLTLSVRAQFAGFRSDAVIDAALVDASIVMHPLLAERYNTNALKVVVANIYDRCTLTHIPASTLRSLHASLLSLVTAAGVTLLDHAAREGLTEAVLPLIASFNALCESDEVDMAAGTYTGRNDSGVLLELGTAVVGFLKEWMDPCVHLLEIEELRCQPQALIKFEVIMSPNKTLKEACRKFGHKKMHLGAFRSLINRIIVGCSDDASEEEYDAVAAGIMYAYRPRSANELVSHNEPPDDMDLVECMCLLDHGKKHFQQICPVYL